MQIILRQLSKHSFWALSVFVFFLFICQYDNYFACIRCLVNSARESTHFSGEKLQMCSNIMQFKDNKRTENVRDMPAGQDGWRMYIVDDSSKPGFITFRIKKEPDMDFMMFYPRISADTDSIEVRAMETSFLAARLRQSHSGWTSIGAKMRVDLGCLDYGWITDRTIEVPVTIILKGKTAQVWHKDGAVFF